MSTVTTFDRPNPAADTDAATAARCLHRAEQALHDAHTTHVDEWISAAADRLHDAVEAYLAAVAAQRHHPSSRVLR
jgi:hypothetical protein